jgi:hypothetical protein
MRPPDDRLHPRLPRFANETEAKSWLEALLQPAVARLEREVWIAHPLRERPIRADYLALIRQFRPLALEPSPVAIEVKAGRDLWQQWCWALAQATAYRYGRICDKRSKVYAGRQPAFAFAFPDPRDSADWRADSYAGWLDGAERLAGRFGVGTIRYRLQWGTGLPELVFCCSAAPLWSTLCGASGPSAFGQHIQIGAR